MRKNFYHILFVLILLLVSFKHYQFAKKDRRNFFDLHEQLYNAPVIDYYYTLQGVSDDQGTPFYAKLFGSVLYLFGKDYFVLRLSYLLFFLLYLGSLYILVFIVSNSAFLALLALFLNLSISGILSYSRMCWPHMDAASLIILGMFFLFCFIKNKRGKYIWAGAFVFCSYLSVKIYCTSFVYLALIVVWLILFHHKKIFSKGKLIRFSFLFVPLLFVLGYFLYEDFVILLGKGLGESYLSAFDFYEYYLLFLNKFHFLIFLVFVLCSVVFFCFSLTKEIQKNTIVFLLFLLFSLVASFFQYPIHVTVLGLSSACVLIAYFIVGLKNNILKRSLFCFIALFVFFFNFNPEIFISQKEAAMRFYKTAIIPDTENWGREELGEWLSDKNINLSKIALLNEGVYPNNGTNYINFLDLDMLLQNGKGNYAELTPVDVFGVYKGDSNVDMSDRKDDADIETTKDPFREGLYSKEVDYLIFDNIFESFYWLFPDSESIVSYKLLKQKIFDNLLENKGFLREIKRIKCPVKDIIIYSIEK